MPGYIQIEGVGEGNAEPLLPHHVDPRHRRHGHDAASRLDRSHVAMLRTAGALHRY